MENKIIFIDFFKGKKVENKILNNENCEFFNFIDYAIKKYNLKIVDIAKILDVTRQTIYKYNSNDYKTEDLPKILKRSIASVYEVSTFEDALMLEFNTLAKEEYIKEIERSFVEHKSLDLIPKTHKKNYNFKVDNNNLKIDLKEEFLHANKWHSFLTKTKEVEKLTESDANLDNLILHLTKNDNNYNKELIKLLQRFKNNDESLLNTLEDLLDNNQNSGEYGLFIAEKEKIQRKLELIVDSKNAIVSIDKEDIPLTPKYYLEFDVKNVNEFNPRFETYFSEKINHLVVNITANNSLNLGEIDYIIGMLSKKLSVDTIVYGFINDIQSSKIKIELFLSIIKEKIYHKKEKK